MLFGDILYGFYTLININFLTTPPNQDPVAEFIQLSGYPVEKHNVVTEDGYILTMHRIPKPQDPCNHHKLVLLVHGLSASGSQWVVNGNKSLAFMLSDSGYDVWILNVRGTSYSLKHRSLSSSHPRFWDFSWHEIGLYDVSGAIDHILDKTGSRQLYFIGHSQGATAFFVLMSVRPKYNDKIAAAYLLQPAALVHNTYPMLKDLFKRLLELVKEQNFSKILLQNSLGGHLAQSFCRERPFSILCANLVLALYGGDTGQIVDKHTMINFSLKYGYDNFSVKQLIHYGQIYGSKIFQMYDYGPLINRKLYNGSSTPPEYDLSRVRVPTVVMYGTKDALVTEVDAKTVIGKLPNVQEIIRLPWNHADLILGKDSDVLHRQIIQSINKYDETF